MDILDDCKTRKKDVKDYRRTNSTGSIVNLIQKTPLNEQKNSRYSNKMTKGNEIFTPDDGEVKKFLRHKVDLESITDSSNNYAGAKTKKHTYQQYFYIE